ncbi:hypothetical protein QTP70_001169 [Hemibagrus guttatus]|uniref:G-protein coupled receptors family 1 profile domain-containing protein n=1 Tax=Hemibagrus guttatus TaxID=175788 RepID=A0AAE0UWF0_9TELE|nr:hypothetical protein QTP70_001169 [Hemibagrus guttatus]
MVSVLVLPMACLYQVLDKWTLGQVACDIFISLDVLCCTSSILHLCAIALDRYWAITEPIDYMKKRTLKRAAVLIGATWLVGFLISVPPMLIMKSQPKSKAAGMANPEACAISHDPWYTIYSTFCAFYIPLILMLVLYGRIFKAARFRIRKTRASGEPGKSWRSSVEPKPASCVNGAVKHTDDGESVEIVEVHGNSKHDLPLPNTPSSAPLFENRHEKNTEAKRKLALARERKTVKTLGIIMGTFILCWLPFFIKALVMPFCPSCQMPVWLQDVINWLGYSNSLLNPIIYAALKKYIISPNSKNDESAYREEVQRLTSWCKDNKLSLNVEKMKEMVVDFRRAQSDHSPLNIDGSNVKIVKSTKFLGVHLVEDLTWSLNTSSITRKAQQCLYFLRRLRKAHLPPTILTIFYRGTIESILSSCITAWFGNCTVSDRKTLQRIVRTAEKIIGVSLPSIMDLYSTRCICKANSIVDDPTHPSHTLFTLLPSGKSLKVALSTAVSWSQAVHTDPSTASVSTTKRRDSDQRQVEEDEDQ